MRCHWPTYKGSIDACKSFQLIHVRGIRFTASHTCPVVVGHLFISVHDVSSNIPFTGSIWGFLVPASCSPCASRRVHMTLLNTGKNVTDVVIGSRTWLIIVVDDIDH